MADCNAANTVGCVNKSPGLAFGVFENMVVLAAGVWVLFLSLHGIIRWTGAGGYKDLITNIFYGISSIFSSFRSSDTSKEAVGLQIDSLTSNVAAKMIYIAVLVATITTGWYFRNSPILGSFILAITLAIGITLQFGIFDLPYMLPIVGGMVMGIVVTVIIWIVQFFTLTPGNEFGSVIMILLVVWLMMTMLAWYGSKTKPALARDRSRWYRSKYNEKRRIQNITMSRVNTGYPTKEWATEFQHSYDAISVSETNEPGSAKSIKSAYLRGLPRLKREYDATGTTDVGEAVIAAYP